MIVKSQVIFIILKCTLVWSLTCDEFLEFPPEKKLFQADLESMVPKDIVQCVAHLGKERLPPSQAEFIWKSIIEFHGEIGSIPDEILQHLKWITVAITPEDYANITFNDIDVIQNFGQDYNLNDAQLSALAGRVREDFSSKEPEDYTNYDLIALRQILCAYNQSDIERIHPLSYKDAAVEIGNLSKCSTTTMSSFAMLAVHDEAFGTIEHWTEDTITDVGKVANYLPKEFLNKFHISPHNG